ncbi:MAG: hypothetical protein LH632_16535 [Rhodoferax sp.]|nr:hypothetical protein [Rhodoferax sp.]
MTRRPSASSSALSVRVMLYGSEPAGRPFRDGFITIRNTFQKCFSQAEFNDVVEQVLDQEVFGVGGVLAVVLANRAASQKVNRVP